MGGIADQQHLIQVKSGRLHLVEPPGIPGLPGCIQFCLRTDQRTEETVVHDLQTGQVDRGVVFDENADLLLGLAHTGGDDAELLFGKCREVIDKDIGRIKAFAARELFTHGAPAGQAVGIPMVKANTLEGVFRVTRMSLREQTAGLAVAAIGAQQQVEGQVTEAGFTAYVVLEVDGLHLRFEMDRDTRSQYFFIQFGYDVVAPVRIHTLAHRGDVELSPKDAVMDDHPEEFRALCANRFPDADLLQDADGGWREDDREGKALRL